MKAEDDEEDLIFSFFFVAFAILIVAFVVVGVGITIWGLL